MKRTFQPFILLQGELTVNVEKWRQWKKKNWLREVTDESNGTGCSGLKQENNEKRREPMIVEDNELIQDKTACDTWQSS